MKRVFLESPYAGDVEQNINYARACVRDSLLRGETPVAPHILFTQDGVLRDSVPNERQFGISAGFFWRDVSDATVIYIDRGLSRGMLEGVHDSISKNVPVEVRRLNSEPPTTIVTEALKALHDLGLDISDNEK